MKTSIHKKLQDEGFDVHRCDVGSDGICYYLVSKRSACDYGDKDGRIFKAIRETPAGDLEVGATLAFFVTRTARAASKTKALMGNFESFLIEAGISHLRELLKGDLSSPPRKDIELNSRSPEKAFTVPAEPDLIGEQRELRFEILRILAKKHSAGLKLVSKNALLEDLCTKIEWVDTALAILTHQKFIDSGLRGEMKLLPAGHLEAEKKISGQNSAPTSASETFQNEKAATGVIFEPDEASGVGKALLRDSDFFISYASEDRSAVENIVSALEARGFKVWWDRGQITLGDRLSQKIDEGLRNSRYGVVIISDSFIAKRWPQSELRSMISRSTTTGEKVILPVLLGLTHNQFAKAYPLLADVVTTQFDGDVDRLVNEISSSIETEPSKPVSSLGQGTGSPLRILYEPVEFGQPSPPYGQLEVFTRSQLSGHTGSHADEGRFAFMLYRVGIKNTSQSTIEGVRLELTSMGDMNNAYLPTLMQVRFGSGSSVTLDREESEFFDIVWIPIQQYNAGPDVDQLILCYANPKFANRVPRKTCEFHFAARAKNVSPSFAKFRLEISDNGAVSFYQFDGDAPVDELTRRKIRARKISKIYADAVGLRNRAASLRVLDEETESRMDDLQDKLTAELRELAPERAINLETLNLYDRKNHPPMALQDPKRTLEFSEFLRRVMKILEDYK